IVDQGRIVALDSPAQLKKQIAGDIVALGYDNESQVKAAAQLLAGNPLVLEQQTSGTTLQIYVDHGDEALPAVSRVVGQGSFTAKTVHLSRPTLDDVFLKLTGRSLHETDGEGARHAG